MRRILQTSVGVLFIAASVPFGWLAFMIGRNMVVNVNLPASQRMASYGIFGLEIKGWVMYGFPIFCGLIFAALLALGISFLRNRSAE